MELPAQSSALGLGLDRVPARWVAVTFGRWRGYLAPEMTRPHVLAGIDRITRRLIALARSVTVAQSTHRGRSPRSTDLAGEGLIRLGVAEVLEFVAQRACPQTRIHNWPAP